MPKGMDDEEIAVAGDEVGSLSTHSELEKLVVLGVTAAGDGDIDFHKLGVVDDDG